MLFPGFQRQTERKIKKSTSHPGRGRPTYLVRRDVPRSSRSAVSRRGLRSRSSVHPSRSGVRGRGRTDDGTVLVDLRRADGAVQRSSAGRQGRNRGAGRRRGEASRVVRVQDAQPVARAKTLKYTKSNGEKFRCNAEFRIKLIYA